MSLSAVIHGLAIITTALFARTATMPQVRNCIDVSKGQAAASVTFMEKSFRAYFGYQKVYATVDRTKRPVVSILPKSIRISAVLFDRLKNKKQAYCSAWGQKRNRMRRRHPVAKICPASLIGRLSDGTVLIRREKWNDEHIKFMRRCHIAW